MSEINSCTVKPDEAGNLFASLPEPPEYYAAVQNGVILEVYENYKDAVARVKEEQQRDLVSIIIKRKLRKLLKKSGNVALHRYYVLGITYEEEIK